MLESRSGALCAPEALGCCSPRDLASPLDLVSLGPAVRRCLSSSHLSTALVGFQAQIQVKCHGMISLHYDEQQLLWNDTLVKKGGGEGVYGALLVPFVSFRASRGSSCGPETQRRTCASSRDHESHTQGTRAKDCPNYENCRFRAAHQKRLYWSPTAPWVPCCSRPSGRSAAFEELNTRRNRRRCFPRSSSLHRVAGAPNIIETNTFGANRSKLAALGLADQVTKINHRGVKIAREAREAAPMRC